MSTSAGQTPGGSWDDADNGRYAVTASDDHTVKIWDSRTGEELLTLKGHRGTVFGLSFSPNGKRLASAGHDQSIKVWDADSGQELLTLNGHVGLVHSVAFSPDGKRLASASWDDSAKVWESYSVPAK